MQYKITKLLSSWLDPGLKFIKWLVVGGSNGKTCQNIFCFFLLRLLCTHIERFSVSRMQDLLYSVIFISFHLLILHKRLCHQIWVFPYKGFIIKLWINCSPCRLVRALTSCTIYSRTNIKPICNQGCEHLILFPLLSC